MPRSGTLLICVQNLDYSGANQVILNIVAGTMHEGNIIIHSPCKGPFGARFAECGAAVRCGVLDNVLHHVRDIFCVICNTIMTAPTVLRISATDTPVIWILHEWWNDEEIIQNLSLRNLDDMNLDTVKQGLAKASNVVFVCNAQRDLYKPTALSTIIYAGVPNPSIEMDKENMVSSLHNNKIPINCLSDSPRPLVFLYIGIVCPRKNQIWAVELFKEFAGDNNDVKLCIVGCRYTRKYELEYLNELKKVINNDPRIELHDVTENVQPFYEQSHVLLFTSLNEVTPMVIIEAMSYGIPVISTNIAGIPEMLTDGVEGYLCHPGEKMKALNAMKRLATNENLRKEMGARGRQRFMQDFNLDIMVNRYRSLIYKVAPPVILIDMDGTLVDWDNSFMREWLDNKYDEQCPVNRSSSYYMENCLTNREYYRMSNLLTHECGFVRNMLPMPGAIEAVKEMIEDGLNVYICSSLVLTSNHCVQEKIDWIKHYLGESMTSKIIFSCNKSHCIGDILIDDKPYDVITPNGYQHSTSWRQVIFDAPYNRHESISLLPRISKWSEWKSVIFPLLGKTPTKFESETYSNNPVSDEIVESKSNSQMTPHNGKMHKSHSDSFEQHLKLHEANDIDEVLLYRASFTYWKKNAMQQHMANTGL